MSDLEALAHSWGDPLALAQSPPQWGQENVLRPSVRKRDRPMSFDAGSLHVSEGNNQYSWGEQFLNFSPEGGDKNAGDQPGGKLEGLSFNQNEVLDFNQNEALNSLLADSADSSDCMSPLQLQDGRNEPGGGYERGAYGQPAYDLAAYGENQNGYGEQTLEQNLDILAQLASGSNLGVDPYTNNPQPPPPPKSATLVLPPTPAAPVPDPPQPLSALLTSAEIQDAYTQSWGGQNLRKDPSLVTPPKENVAEKGQEWSVNGAKTQAASIIRDLFRRPEAKRQAVVVEGGRVGFLEKTLGRLSTRNPKPSQASGPARSTSGPAVSDARSGGQSTQVKAPPQPAAPTRTLSDPPETSRADSSQRKRDESSFQRGGDESKEEAIAETMQRIGERVAGAFAVECEAGLPLYGGVTEGVKTGAGIGGAKGGSQSGSERGGAPSVSGVPDLTTAAGLEWLLEDETEMRRTGAGQTAGPSADVSPDLWVPGFAEWLARSGQGSAGATSGAASLAEPLAGMSLKSKSLPTHLPPALHRLWVELAPVQLRSDAYRAHRTAYREEIRRLRCWTATYVGKGLLPLLIDLHLGICNALPGVQSRQARMMFTKGALWGGFVTDTLDNASPCDLYYARHDSQREFKEGPLQKLANLSKGMQHKMLNIVYLMEDLKDEATYGPELYRTYGALHKSGGLSLPPPIRGHAYHQISFPELTEPKSPPSPEGGAEAPGNLPPLDDVELIKFEEKPLFNPCTLLPNGHLAPWGSFWYNKNRLLATGKGLQDAGERARQLVQGLAERTLAAHVKRYDCLASGGMPTLEKYLEFARYDIGVATGLGLAFCAIGQGLADEGRWEPSVDALNALFEAIARALTLTSEIYRLMSDLRTYQDDLVNCRLNAVAIRMREALCSNKEATDFLIVKVASVVEVLESEILAHASGDHFSSACWRLVFDVCRTGVARFLATEHDQFVDILFHEV